eukprot:CAMPEP_0172162364 /NCGR_PEP_ID=MMETSP1050-20130122/6626_1 /TAXON_ID=233186 /ORGANISM="Cryptomonas curvata, Strain CCAP979/52" /LENGTH=128 /DNA_ID=CAMNT_0012832337 /DNA_START=150 /DNA_END=533 /DNA_ORIENTATION=-
MSVQSLPAVRTSNTQEEARGSSLPFVTDADIITGTVSGFPAARAKPDKAGPFLFRGNGAAPIVVPHHGHGTPSMPLGTGPAQQHSINAAEAALNSFDFWTEEEHARFVAAVEGLKSPPDYNIVSAHLG